MYIWQQPDWPRFTWQDSVLRARLESVRLLQGRLLGRRDALPPDAGHEAEMEALIQSALRTNEIEGEKLDAESVRSSVARQLGLAHAGMPGPDRQAESLVALLRDATTEHARPLTLQRLCQWQALLFPDGPGPLRNIRVGNLRGTDPMQVVSGRIDRPTVRFEAPPRESLERELDAFLEWFNDPPADLDGLVRAGIAHLWLITLHPFDDGNGRIARAVTDMALAQAEQQGIRFQSLSAAIMNRREEYYRVLEQTQKDPLDITDWLDWFLDVLEDALHEAIQRFERVLQKARFWQRHSRTVMNERQMHVLNRLLDRAGEEFPDGINATQYRRLARVSKATATRDLTDLLAKGCLVHVAGGGRSTRYRLALDNVRPDDP